MILFKECFKSKYSNLLVEKKEKDNYNYEIKIVNKGRNISFKSKYGSFQFDDNNDDEKEESKGIELQEVEWGL